MDSNFKPINAEDIFPNLDSETLSKIFSSEPRSEKSQVETIDYLLKALSIEKESIKYKDIFLRNYIYTSLVARKHLLEIEERIKRIEAQANCIGNKESYPYRKLIHFQKKNEKGKDEIINFLCYGLVKYISDNNDIYSDLINRDNADKMWLLGPTYDYNYNHKYYDPNFDFSTYVKFYDTPNLSILESFKNIDKMIALKKADSEQYYQKVIDNVDSNNLLENMAERISNNFHFHKRKEIFETMATLFKEEKYASFILTATIQIEGMFYELVTIRYGEKNNQGTLVDKVDKTFSKNSQQKHALYPYFAFDIPILRNKVAHIGLVETENIKNKAYELVLDLNCILSLAEKESLDKFKFIIHIFDKTLEIDRKDYENEYDYHSGLAKCVFEELYMSSLMVDDYFWDLLAEPNNHEDELTFYLPYSTEDKDLYLIDIVHILSTIVYSDVFWEIVLINANGLSEIKPDTIHDFGSFIAKLKNVFIPRLSGKAKKLCCQVNQKLQTLNKY